MDTPRKKSALKKEQAENNDELAQIASSTGGIDEGIVKGAEKQSAGASPDPLKMMMGCNLVGIAFILFMMSHQDFSSERI
eukprot:CAMPEP_0168351246 /NCGR_PEP_ID=MMETSP0213-20121227/21720_1 /TAXON_ID=151035 /ORGANISM="Euplotes harpa, Strain FSP1.4" /LENGTH=79 /DNA_ID=CAMNT_0008361987 /DNA_START=46 /DNA_END=282 /DNA_ORIENTATION=+